MNESPDVVVVYAPQGAGKSRHAAALAQTFGCTRIVDDWDGQSPLPLRALAMTHMLPEAMEAAPDTVVLYAPQGAGKSRHAAAVARMFGCARIVDGWDGKSRLPAQALVLTHVLPGTGGAGLDGAP